MSTPSTEELLKRMEDAREAILKASETLVKAVLDLGEPPRSKPSHVVRYPCSATCTHDDAASPGHPERVKALSAPFSLEEVSAFSGCQNDRERVCYAAGRERGLDEGAEIMRAACREAVQGLLQKEGFCGGILADMLDKAIEGATP